MTNELDVMRLAYEKLTPEQTEELFGEISKGLNELAPVLAMLLYNYGPAKNYLSLNFTWPDTGEPCFDLILRKSKADENIICSTCGFPKVITHDNRVIKSDTEI